MPLAAHLRVLTLLKMAAITTVTNTFLNSVPGMEVTVAIVVAIVVVRLFDIGRQWAFMRRQAVGPISAGFFVHSKKLSAYTPETLGLLFCLGLAGALRVRASVDNTLVTTDPHMAALASIAREWPILLGADTLLSLQAMLRVCVLASSVLRRGGGLSLLTQEAVVIACGAALGRVALVARSDVYMLDGPLGGHLPTACEVMSLALLLVLCRGIHLRSMIEATLTLAVAACVASSNRLSLAADPVTDGLFIFAIVAELLAALSYLCRAVTSDVMASASNEDTVAMWFAHIIMPVQACFSAYYWRAFEAAPQLIGAGRPFEILQWGCFAQVCAYAGAALLHGAESFQKSQGSLKHTPQNPVLA